MVYYISEDSIFQIRATKPKARNDLKKFSTHLRKHMGIKIDQLYVDVLSILEFILPKKDKTFEFVVPDRWFTNEIRPAFYNPEENRIYIRADIYDKLLKNDGFARFTVMHEICHYFLFKIIGIPELVDWEDVMHYSDAKLHSIDPEWQANVMASLILCNPELIKDMSIFEVCDQCGVSLKAAESAWNNANEIKYEDIYILNYAGIFC